MRTDIQAEMKLDWEGKGVLIHHPALAGLKVWWLGWVEAKIEAKIEDSELSSISTRVLYNHLCTNTLGNGINLPPPSYN